MNAFLKSFGYAFKGIRLSLKQRNIKVQVVCALLICLLGFIFKIKQTEWCIILICIAAVLALEIMNTAIEHLVNFVEPNHNSKAGAIKDLAAGAVLIFSIISAIIGILIFGKYVVDLLNF